MHYRFYYLNQSDHIVKAVDHEAAEDLEALEVATRLAKDGPIEIWEDCRIVAKLGTDGQAMPLKEAA
jgi:hypothetical protein